MPERGPAFIPAENPPREILVVKPSSLGDVVQTLPAVDLLKRRYPAARIRWLINTEWAPVLKGNPSIDEIVEFPRRSFRGIAAPLRIALWARHLRQRVQADLVLDFQGLLRSALISRLCRGKGGRIFGLSDAREGASRFYDQTVDVSGCRHSVDRYLTLVRALGHCTEETPVSWLPPFIQQSGTPPLPPHYVLLHPFSRGEGKSLAVSEIIAFVDEMAPVPVIVAGRADVALPPRPNLLNRLNQTSLHELIYLLRSAGYVVSVDSGPMHIAAALTHRLVSIHTWSDPRKVGPYQPEAWVLQQGELRRMRNLDKPAEATARDTAALATFVKAQF